MRSRCLRRSPANSAHLSAFSSLSYYSRLAARSQYCCSPNLNNLAGCQGCLRGLEPPASSCVVKAHELGHGEVPIQVLRLDRLRIALDRKSTRLNSSHSQISY